MLQYRLYNVVDRSRYIHGQCICRLFERFKLTLEHMRLHKMIGAFFHARPDQLITTAKMDDLYVFAALGQPLTIMLFERGAGQHSGAIRF